MNIAVHKGLEFASSVMVGLKLIFGRHHAQSHRLWQVRVHASSFRRVFLFYQHFHTLLRAHLQRKSSSTDQKESEQDRTELYRESGNC